MIFMKKIKQNNIIRQDDPDSVVRSTQVETLLP